FVTSVPSAILPVVTPPGPRDIFTKNCIDSNPPTRLRDDPSLVDRTRPTIVLTHGWLEEDVTINELWSGFADRRAGSLLCNALGDGVNILQYIWDESQTIRDVPRGEPYKAARREANNAGERLGKELIEILRTDYSKSIHFIGHSLGTVVNAYAARSFINKAASVEDVQVTILDYPNHVEKIPGLNLQEERIYGIPSDFFAAVLPIGRPGLSLNIDNFYSLTGFTGVGDRANGPIYNHDAKFDDDSTNGLEKPNDVGGGVFGDEDRFGFADTDHSGVHQWYRWTIFPNNPFPDGRTVCEGDDFAIDFFPGLPPLSRKPPGFDDSLNPCQRGWAWAINNPIDDPGLQSAPFPGVNGVPVTTSFTRALDIERWVDFGCRQIISPVFPFFISSCIETSSPFGVGEIDIPSDAEFLSFEYQFANTGDGDYAAVLIDNVPIWVLSGSSATEGELIDSGPIPINGLTGKRRITIALYGVGQPNAELQIQNFRTSSVIEGIPQCFGVHATIVGTDGRDRLTGTQGRDVIVGLGGNDIINGRSGKDLICGGKGKDKLHGGKGKDKLDGGTGRDVCKGGPGRDIARRCERVSKIP
ncbi:MAG: hypothetical protein ACRDGA_13195, partial [Bacteroidota bacterium]